MDSPMILFGRIKKKKIIAKTERRKTSQIQDKKNTGYDWVHQSLFKFYYPDSTKVLFSSGY